MGQKVNPIGMRTGIIRDWNSKWYAERADYADKLIADFALRKFLKKKLANAAVSRVLIERPARNAKVIIYSAKPGVIIGKKGGGIEDLRLEAGQRLGVPVHLTVEEIRTPELDATLVAENIAQQLEHRIMFRRAMKRAISSSMRAGALGIKIQISGRLNGSEIARTESYREGRVPLHTFRADIDYGLAEAHTTYGVIGVKVWIFIREVTPHIQEEKEAAV